MFITEIQITNTNLTFYVFTGLCLFDTCDLGKPHRIKIHVLAKRVWGTYLDYNWPSSNGHLLDFGGVKKLARMVWGTLFRRNHTNLQNVKIGPEKKCHRVPVCVWGRGPSAIWAMPK